MQAFNPYLPNWEYAPDGEPHVFNGRLYVFGSHNRFGGKKFCMNDYVSWSTPVDDLPAWHKLDIPNSIPEKDLSHERDKISLMG